MLQPFDPDAAVRFVLALVIVLGLIFLSGWIFRRMNGPALLDRRSTKRRLRVIETLPLDTRHRLVLVQRDEVAHLVLLGTGTPVVVEADIPSHPSGTTPDELARSQRQSPKEPS